MTIHEYGKKNKKILVLIHPAVVMWDYFDEVIPLLEAKYHLIIPALPGYDKESPSDFSSIEEIASELVQWLKKEGYFSLFGIYGCSLGGSVAIRMMAEMAKGISPPLQVEHILLDGAITPYQLPYWVTRFIALRDFLMVSMGKKGGRKLLIKSFSKADYSPSEMSAVVDYMTGVFDFISYKTIWRSFDSCNNYSMPKEPFPVEGSIHYWYAESEKKARKWDLQYVQKQFPKTLFTAIANLGHGGLAVFDPKQFVQRIEALV